jgi:hypothetical protein
MAGRVKSPGWISPVRESHVRVQRLLTHVKSKRRVLFFMWARAQRLCLSTQQVTRSHRQVITNKKMLPLYLSCFVFPYITSSAPTSHRHHSTTASVGPLEARAHDDYFLPSVVFQQPQQIYLQNSTNKLTPRNSLEVIFFNNVDKNSSQNCLSKRFQFISSYLLPKAVSAGVDLEHFPRLLRRVSIHYL